MTEEREAALRAERFGVIRTIVDHTVDTVDGYGSEDWFSVCSDIATFGALLLKGDPSTPGRVRMMTSLIAALVVCFDRHEEARDLADSGVFATETESTP